MRHVHSLRFEVLEPRRLLARVHVTVAHPASAMDVVPLVLNGSLAVDDRAAITSMNVDGSTTTSVPVAGRLGTVGEVRGVWNESVDTYGNHDGPDVLRLQNSKGTLVITFNNENPGKATFLAPGNVYFPHTQRLFAGTGAYAHALESGTIEVISNAAKTVVKSLALNSQST
jgi:hypothetical protein